MKFIDSYFDRITGVSSVEIQHRGKRFRGFAYLHPEDKDKTSAFAGCAYAEQRAYIKALKYERARLKEEAEFCRKFVKACSGYRNWDPKSPIAKVVYRQLNRKIKAVNDITDEINDELFRLQYRIGRRDIVLKEIEKNKQNKLNDNSEN